MSSIQWYQAFYVLPSVTNIRSSTSDVTTLAVIGYNIIF